MVRTWLHRIPDGSARTAASGTLARRWCGRHLRLTYGREMSATPIGAASSSRAIAVKSRRAARSSCSFAATSRFPCTTAPRRSSGRCGSRCRKRITRAWANCGTRRGVRASRHTSGGYHRASSHIILLRLSLKTNLHTKPVGERPTIELEPTGHPLATEQRDGITMARVRQIAETMMHLPLAQD